MSLKNKLIGFKASEEEKANFELACAKKFTKPSHVLWQFMNEYTNKNLTNK